MRRLLPGIVLAVLVSLVSFLLGKFVPSLGDVTIAILLGIALSNLMALPASVDEGSEFCEKKLQSFAVVLMGFSLNMATIRELGVSSIAVLFILILITVATSWLAAERFGLTRSLGTLLGVGNAICGASAIAATSSLVTKSKEEVGISIGVVNLLGTVGIFLLPVLVHLLNFNSFEASLLIGGGLQAVSHVVAAAYSVDTEVGEMAIAVKMARIFLLGPTLMLFSLFIKREAVSGRSGIFSLPTYLYGFAACAVIGNLGVLPAPVIAILQRASHVMLLVAMAGIGLRIRIAALLQQGPRALMFGLCMFLLQLSVLALAIVYLLS